MSIVAKDVTALAWDLWYITNKEYIARELCVNKAKPKLHCDGKCCLAKKLQKLEEAPAKDQKAPVSGMKVKEVDWIAANASAASITEEAPGFVAHDAWNGWQELNRAPHSFSAPIFHPPTA